MSIVTVRRTSILTNLGLIVVLSILTFTLLLIFASIQDQLKSKISCISGNGDQGTPKLLQLTNVNLVNLPFTNFSELGRNKTGRRFWEAMTPSIICPEELFERVGRKEDGGKWTCGMSTLAKLAKKERSVRDCLIYSFGVNNESSFEADVLERTNCQIYAYDPSVDSIGYPVRADHPRVHFQKLGIGGKEGGDKKTLKGMMEENGGHRWIDFLKMDVELYELTVLPNILEDFPNVLPFGQFVVEVHARGWKENQKKEITDLFEALERRGLRIFFVEPNVKYPDCCAEYSFLNMYALNLFLEQQHTSDFMMVDGN